MSAVPSKEDYVLQHDYKASYRLNYGHFHHTAITGYLLHPSIPVPNTKETEFRIADLGGGTGIWSIYTARWLREKTNARIDCFDISGEQFPPIPWRTNDIHYHVHDCFQAFPEEYLGQFDVVFIRFWATFVKDDNVPELLQNFRSLLKPGGYLSWQEPVFGKSALIKKNPDLSSTLTEEMVSMFRNAQEKKTWPARLPELIREGGYEAVVSSEYSVPDELRPIGEPYSLAGILEAKIIPDEVKDRALKKYEEFAHGVTFDTRFQIVVGHISS